MHTRDQLGSQSISGSTGEVVSGRGPELARAACFHCGTLCREDGLVHEGRAFCCVGCRTVFDLLSGVGLTDFYKLSDQAGVRVTQGVQPGAYDYLDAPEVLDALVDYRDERTTRLTLRLPAIHCIACVWLLENLFRLKPGIGSSQVHFPKKEITVHYDTQRVRLSELVGLLASLGYPPDLKLSDLDARRPDPARRRLWLQLAFAGFAFGNTMLFSIATYFGLDTFSGPGFKKLFGVISFLLSLPVVGYSALPYWQSAWVGLRHRMLTIEVPIAAGIVAIFAQSVYEVFSGHGEGYFDSLAGLLFFLLCGRLFQQKTYDRLAFDRDFKSFFPLSAIRRKGSVEERVALAQVRVGDLLVLRNGELIPADARLIDGVALIDYSFVTGESEPVSRPVGERLFAGGRQMGGAIVIEVVKPVSQGYLTSLWNQEAFRKDKSDSLDTLTNRYSQRFTWMVLAIACGAAVYWSLNEPARALKSFISVLIVACPCALALAAPFTLGTAQRFLARRNIFLKNPTVLETLARVDAVVFDKTGTLTAAGAGSVVFHGAGLTEAEERLAHSLTRHSTHPHAVRICDALARDYFPEPVRSFLETAGCGIEGSVQGREVWMGSSTWFESRGLKVPEGPKDVPTGGVVHLALDGVYRGCFALSGALRPRADRLLRELASTHQLALLSGDHPRERERFGALFGQGAELCFNQSPLDKLSFIHGLQRGGRKVMMVGDGLNDAGALQQSDVGVAVVENVHAFSPASDVILAAQHVPSIGSIQRFARQTVRVVRGSFLISSLYNVIGIAIAAKGLLSPIVCAILMPLSSVSVVAFACGATVWMGRRAGLPTEAVARGTGGKG